jgi:hypothetical protein
MATIKQPLKQNPLMQFMRQPKIYVKLPSNGTFWEEGSINLPENLELPVYSMTAKDELTFKTPDALMNGQGVVEVIQSCIPNIKDAWATPNIDLDVILIAIRLATYGEQMEISHKVPNTEETVEHLVDLRRLLDSIFERTVWKEEVVVNENISCYIKPLTYKHLTQTSIKTFEAQRIMTVINNDSVSDEQKLEVFNKSFSTMTDITVKLIADSIYAIKTPDTVVEDPKFILEFVQNADKDVFDLINKRINTLKESNGLQPIIVESTPEQIEAGAPETYPVPISFDNANFFANGS